MQSCLSLLTKPHVEPFDVAVGSVVDVPSAATVTRSVDTPIGVHESRKDIHPTTQDIWECPDAGVPSKLPTAELAHDHRATGPHTEVFAHVWFEPHTRHRFYKSPTPLWLTCCDVKPVRVTTIAQVGSQQVAPDWVREIGLNHVAAPALTEDSCIVPAEVFTPPCPAFRPSGDFGLKEPLGGATAPTSAERGLSNWMYPGFPSQVVLGLVVRFGHLALVARPVWIYNLERRKRHAPFRVAERLLVRARKSRRGRR